MNTSAQDQLRVEIHSAIRRYGQESDLSVYMAVAVLEVVKFDLLEMLTKATSEE